MPKITGRNVSIGFGKETTRGTAVAPSVWFPKTNMTFEEKIETLVNEQAIGTIMDSIGHEVTKKWSQGEVSGNLSVNAIGLILYALLGNVSSAVDSWTAYRHTFTLSNSNQSPSLTTATSDAIANLRFALSIVKKLTIKIEPKKFVEVTFEIIGKSGTTVSNTVAFSEDYELSAHNTSLVYALNLAGLDAATQNGCIKSFELTLERTVTEDECISTTDPEDFLSTAFSITGNIVTTYENTTAYKADALSGATRALRLLISDGNTIIWGATSYPELQIDLAKIGFTEYAKNGSGNEIVTQSAGFKGFYSISDGKAIEVQLVNTISSI